ncbi:carbon-nitrogen hydrolase family protein [Alkanindiges sp. WGS2144]|uniref:carbon-nitrogen hydrolase family protein n=1 Tax=Alkanindiges sp. WGS2144 TaxID=3366808 RepID=UPI0037531ABA
MASVKVAAIQLEPKIGDVQANLAACKNMADEAGQKGAKWIVLPEFFATGMAFDPDIVDAIEPPNGPALALLLDLAKRHQAFVGGSFIVRDEDSSVRNAFYLVSPQGILGRHDKDLPTMWENCFYTSGSDDGIIKAQEHRAGVSLCWEFMRSQTARRLRNNVDVIVGGSCWWSVPQWSPKALTYRWEQQNQQNAHESVRAFASYVGAPVIHAAHVGAIECRLPGVPLNYKGYYEAGSMIVDAQGNMLAFRDRHAGQGLVMADIRIGRTTPVQEIPATYWLHQRGPIPSLAWTYQRWHGKHWYKKHVA